MRQSATVTPAVNGNSLASNSTPPTPATDATGRQEGKPGRKTVCPITRAQFRAAARGITITVNGNSFLVPPKEFSTGSLGWYLNGKTVIEVDGVPVQVQLGLSLTIVGSKELPS